MYGKSLGLNRKHHRVYVSQGGVVVLQSQVSDKMQCVHHTVLKRKEI